MTKADKIFAKKIKELLDAEKRTSKAVKKLQQELFNLIASEYTPLFKLGKDGRVLNNKFNAALLAKIDDIFDSLGSAMTKDVLSVFVNGLFGSIVTSAEYYEALGLGEKVAKSALSVKSVLETKLGIKPSGALKKDGYIYKLGRTESVRQRLKTYVLTSLTGDVAFTDFQLGFRNLVIGNRRVKSLPTTGVLERYFDQFAYDAFNQVDASANIQFAEELSLTHFQYTGSLIATSRRFCEKRAGKVFTVAETANWKNDPDLIDKKTKDSYSPLVERGRYRCRHFLKFITFELYNELK